jgi:hypothetical protein
MNELDDFICTVQSDELAQYAYDWKNRDNWAEVESCFVEELGVETECFED